MSLLTVQQVSAETGFSSQKIIRLIAAGKLAAIDTSTGGGRKPRWSIRQEDLDEFLTPKKLKLDTRKK